MRALPRVAGVPGGLSGRPLPGGPLELTGPDGAGGRLVTGDRFVADPGERTFLAERADLVDMEGYAVAAVCRRFDVGVWIAKCVSDTADGQAAASWRETLAIAAEGLGVWVRGGVTCCRRGRDRLAA